MKIWIFWLYPPLCVTAMWCQRPSSTRDEEVKVLTIALAAFFAWMKIKPVGVCPIRLPATEGSPVEPRRFIRMAASRLLTPVDATTPVEHIQKQMVFSLVARTADGTWTPVTGTFT